MTPSNLNIPEPLPKLGGRHSVASYWRKKPEFYRLAGSKCRKCGKKYFPRRPICPICKNTEMETIRFSDHGRVKSIQMGLGSIMGFEDMRPQIYCVVELDKEVFVQAELLGVPYSFTKQQLSNPDQERMTKDLQGLEVQMVVRRLRKMDNGYPTYGYKFQRIGT